MYEAVIIDTSIQDTIIKFSKITTPKESRDIITEQKVIVNKDVQALHQLLFFNESVMLPCPECNRTQPFFPNNSVNPQKATNYILEHALLVASSSHEVKDSPNLASKERKNNTHINVFNRPIIHYILGQNELKPVGGDLGADFDNSQVMQSCMDGILETAAEFRRDFLCSYDNQHRIMVDCVLQRAIDLCREPKELQEYRKRKVANPELEMTEREKEISEQYEHLKYCLILEKVGQEPSMADLQMFDIEKYRKVLSSDRFRDFSMALGLYASGVGCGAMLYLRRIFESIVTTMQKECETDAKWAEEEYARKRFNEKIDYIESFGKRIIPDELSDVKEKIYGWLSRGVHELSEQESKEFFPYLKYTIELILDEQLSQKEKEDKLKELKKKLNS